MTHFFKFISGDHQQKQESSGKGVQHANTDMLVLKAAKELTQFLDPADLLSSKAGTRQPLIILAFDDNHSHILTTIQVERGVPLFTELVWALHLITVIDLPIFSLFLSTPPIFHSFSQTYQSALSNQMVNVNLPLPPAITETSFDDLAFPVIEDKVTLDEVIEDRWISHLGRPMYEPLTFWSVNKLIYLERFGSRYGATVMREEHSDFHSRELMDFVKSKLLDGPTRINDTKGVGSLACLSVRFALDFNLADKSGRDLTLTLVERHMRLCIAATANFENVITMAGSEPYIAEAARELMSKVGAVQLLADNTHLSCIDLGRHGELVVAMLIMRARDACHDATVGRNWGHARVPSRVVSIDSFMRALLPVSVYEKLKSVKPQHWRSGEDKPFSETFEGYRTWFNHIIKVHNTDIIKTAHLWKFITRGSMIMCVNNQLGIDLVIPVCTRDNKLSRRTVTAILIQVKNDKNFKYKVDKPLIDCMDPFRVGLFSEDDRPLPVIRMVFALGSDKTGVVFPAVEDARRDVDAFTGYDIWCAGLSMDTFRDIGSDLEWYKSLLLRTVQPLDGFEVKDAKDRYRDETTDQARGRLRRRMAPLMVETHGCIHDSRNSSSDALAAAMVQGS